ncbi:MAG: hypothetical protein ACP5UH_01720 [Candidatus Micrarchaeia archaeon]
MIIIGIDLDGVLSRSWETVFTPYHSETLYNKIRGSPGSTRKRIADLVVDELFKEKWENWRGIHLLDNSIPEILRKFSTFARIEIVTSTSGKEANIKKWLKANGIPYNSIIYSPPNDKWRHCDILIDNRSDVINEAVKHGKIGILLSKKNEFYGRAGNLFFARDWNEVYEIVTSEATKLQGKMKTA